MSDPLRWLVIFAPEDSSYSLVPDVDVICDPSVKVGDDVMFVYGSRKKPLDGVVKAIGEDYDDLQKAMTEMNRKPPKRTNSNLSDRQDGSKRQRRAKLKCKESLSSSNVICKKKEQTPDNKSKQLSALERVLKGEGEFNFSHSGKNVFYSGENDDENTSDSNSLMSCGTDVDNLTDQNDSQSSAEEELSQEEIAQVMKIIKGKKLKDISSLSKLSKQAPLKDNNIASTSNSSSHSRAAWSQINSSKCTGWTDSDTDQESDDNTKIRSSSTEENNGKEDEDLSEREKTAPVENDKKKGKDTAVGESKNAAKETSSKNGKDTAVRENKNAAKETTSKNGKDTAVRESKNAAKETSSKNGKDTAVRENKNASKEITSKNGKGTAAGREKQSAAFERENEDVSLDVSSDNGGNLMSPNGAKRYSRRKKYEKAVFEGKFFRVDANTPGSYQLVPSHKVYVLESNLKDIKNESKTILTVARKLVREVFTEEAIMTCTVTGRPSSGRAGVPSVIRPALDPEGVKAIYKYCVARASKKNKSEPTFSEVKRSIGEILNETRYTAKLEQHESSI